MESDDEFLKQFPVSLRDIIKATCIWGNYGKDPITMLSTVFQNAVISWRDLKDHIMFGLLVMGKNDEWIIHAVPSAGYDSNIDALKRVHENWDKTIAELRKERNGKSKEK